FALESSESPLVADELRVEDLDRDVAVEGGLQGLEDGSEAALAKLLRQPILPERFADHNCAARICCASPASTPVIWRRRLVDAAGQICGLENDDVLVLDVNDTARSVRAEMLVNTFTCCADHGRQLLLRQAEAD